MASVLSLTDECLHIIISYLDNQSSFLSFVLTCQRFLRVTKNKRSVLNTTLLQAKAEFYIKRYIVEIGNDYKKLSKLQVLLRDSARLTKAKRLITYDRLIDVWQNSGPVAAKLFTWILGADSSREECKPRATCYTRERVLTLHLPNCNENMMIITSFFGDFCPLYDLEISIHVFCGDLVVKSNYFVARYTPEDFMHWNAEEVKSAVERMRDVMALLQKELGATVPPITAQFFVSR